MAGRSGVCCSPLRNGGKRLAAPSADGTGGALPCLLGERPGPQHGDEGPDLGDLNLARDAVLSGDPQHGHVEALLALAAQGELAVRRCRELRISVGRRRGSSRGGVGVLCNRVDPLLVCLVEVLQVGPGDGLALPVPLLDSGLAGVDGSGEVNDASDRHVLGQEVVPALVEAPLELGELALLLEHLGKDVAVSEDRALRDQDSILARMVGHRLARVGNARHQGGVLEHVGVALRVFVEELKDVLVVLRRLLLHEGEGEEATTEGADSNPKKEAKE